MWRPLASVNTLKQRAETLQKIRYFFEQQGVMEVDTPLLGQNGVTDPYLDALTIDVQGQQCYLQTSPEYFMKRLLAAGSGDIFYLGKAFRKDESGRIHHHEFTMLEWYRLGFNDEQLIDEIISLVQFLKPSIQVCRSSYSALFQTHLNINPHTCSAEELQQIASERLDLNWSDDDKPGWLDLLFSHVIEPNLQGGLHVVYDYPACQSALAKIENDTDGIPVAKRFECFLDGVELANGYWELTDVAEQRERFEADVALRRQKRLKPVEIDENLMAAVKQGIPECAGVALGVDRLIMSLLDLPSISSQRTF